MSEIKPKQNSFKTVLFQPKQPWNVFSCFSQSQASICCLCKTAVYDAVSQTLVNEHGDHMRY